MAEGFALDKTDSVKRQAEWVEGEPVISKWTGAKIKGRTVLPIETFRCERCYFLESYAPAP